LINVNRQFDLAIGVPVRNEVDRLPRLLSALAAQSGDLQFLLCIFFDNCSDGSAQLVEAWADRLPFAIISDCCVQGRAPNAGAARARAMALAMREAPAGSLLTTDADSEPASDWMVANLHALNHADVVAGRITRWPEGSGDRQDRICRYFDRLHAIRRAIDPVPWEAEKTHHWTSGASLAISAQVYQKLGGFAAKVSGEDAAFADSASQHGFRVRRDGGVMVRTSSRRVGRALHGFAASLAALDEGVQTPDVAHPDDEAWRFHMQARSRTAFDVGDLRLLPDALGLPQSEVETVAAECANSEAFATRIVGAPPGGMRMVSLGHAEALLANADQIALVGAA
jgi:hypothetical protein